MENLEGIKKEIENCTKMLAFEIEVYNLELKENDWILCNIYLEGNKLIDSYYNNEVEIYNNEEQNLNYYLEGLMDCIIESICNDKDLTFRSE